ncbi:MAG: hypothetical protein LC659_12560 [Myxococcales bacterium]|nr:hypothetical protein [Myxococcales bacterium]
MLALPLLVTTLTLAPTGTSSRVELGVAGEFDETTVGLPPALALSSAGLSVGGKGGVGLTLFGTRVVDDDAAPALQPFLQRTAALQLDAGGGGFDLTPPDGSALVPHHGSLAYADVSAWGYADGFLYAFVGLGLRYRSDERQMLTTYTIPVDVAVGARLGDARVALGWTVAPTRTNDGVFEVAFWGGAYARIFGVVNRTLALDAEVQIVDGGAGANGGATVYLARRFSIGAFARGGHGSPSDFHYSYDHAGAGVTLEARTSARFAVAVTYSIDWYKYTPVGSESENDYTNLIDLSFRLRPR